MCRLFSCHDSVLVIGKLSAENGHSLVMIIQRWRSPRVMPLRKKSTERSPRAMLLRKKSTERSSHVMPLHNKSTDCFLGLPSLFNLDR